MPDDFWPHVRMDPHELDEYLEIVARATRAYAGRLEVRVGMETDYFPGYEWWAEKLNEHAEFHHILGSVHFFGPEYKQRYWKGNLFDFQKTYFRHLADSAETGLFDTLAHPDLIKNLQPDEFDFDRLEETIAESLDRIARTGVAMELNTSGLHKRYPEVNPGPRMLAMMRQRNIPVVLGSDSHTPNRVGADFYHALEVLQHAGYSKVSYFNLRKRYDIAISEVVSALDAHRTAQQPEAALA
jgi:histidinol-phosphatase (PHP family)